MDIAAKVILKTLIIGVGNPLRRDDGVGIAVIKKLRNTKLDPKINDNIELYDGGTDGLALLDIISLYHKVIIIDAVNMNLPPATIKIFIPQEAIININSDALSTHGFGLAEIIKLIEQLEIKTELMIIGIQPKDISFGENLSIEIYNIIDNVINLAISNI